MKNYKIGRFTKEMGVSAELLKHYEEHGLIQPRRDDDSKYRYYDIYHGGRIVTCKTLRNMGFSVRQTAKAVNDMDTGEMAGELELARLRLEQEREELEQRIRMLEEYARMWDCFADPEAHIQVEERPGYYYLAQSRNERFIQKEHQRETASRLLDMLPHSERLLVVPQSALEGEFVYYWGMALREDRAEGFPLDKFAYYPPAACLKIPVIWVNRGPVGPDRLERPMEVLRERGYTLGEGDILCQVPLSTGKNGVSTSHNIFYMPIQST